MFYTATITDKDNAQKIRRQLRKAGFAYNPYLKTWVRNSCTVRGARYDLKRVREIEGIEWQRHTAEEHQQRIDEAVERRVKTA